MAFKHAISSILVGSTDELSAHQAFWKNYSIRDVCSPGWKSQWSTVINECYSKGSLDVNENRRHTSLATPPILNLRAPRPILTFVSVNEDIGIVRFTLDARINTSSLKKSAPAALGGLRRFGAWLRSEDIVDNHVDAKTAPLVGTPFVQSACYIRDALNGNC